AVGLPLGRVVTTPPGIDCDLLCTSQSASFPGGTVVTLTAQATVTGTFKGWTGDCSGDGPCVLTMDADKRVTAHFSPLPGGNASSSDTGSVALVRSRLDVPQGRAEVSVNGRSVLTAGSGAAQVSVPLLAGDNLVEGWLREAGGDGLWRLELRCPAASGGTTVTVVAGDPVLVAPDAIVFRLRGRPGERVSFVLRLSPRDPIR